MKKLIEEITRAVHKFWIDTQHGHTPGFEVSFSEFLITRIGKAYADGELDEELGVIRRIDWNREWMILPGGSPWRVPKGTYLIALRKEEQQSNMPRYCEHCGSEEHYTSEH